MEGAHEPQRWIGPCGTYGCEQCTLRGFLLATIAMADGGKARDELFDLAMRFWPPADVRRELALLLVRDLVTAVGDLLVATDAGLMAADDMG